MSRETVDTVKEAYRLARRGNPQDLLELLDPDVTWAGVDGVRWKPCENADEVVKTLFWRATMHRFRAAEAIDLGDTVVVGLRGTRLGRLGAPWWAFKLFQVVTVRGGRIVGIRDYARRGDALAAAGLKR